MAGDGGYWCNSPPVQGVPSRRAFVIMGWNFERGVGETRACGTGACAAMAAGRRAGAFDERVTITLPGGALSLYWPGAGAPLWMTGPAVVSFRGEIGD